MTKQELKTKAAGGDSKAQLDLGNKYYIGLLGFEKDIDKAFYWWSRAAENDNREAQFSLGMLFYTGEGMVRDTKEAFLWWKKAAQKDHPIAKRYLKAPPQI